MALQSRLPFQLPLLGVKLPVTDRVLKHSVVCRMTKFGLSVKTTFPYHRDVRTA